MPRLSETPHQRQTSRVPLRLKPTASSKANSLSLAAMDRSSKIENRRSPRTVLPEKRRGSRMADLETKLDQTMEELKNLKEQLALEEAAKRVMQKKLEKTKKVVAFSHSRATVSSPVDLEGKKENLFPVEIDSESCTTTDVCELVTSCSEENGNQMESEVVIQESAESLRMADVRAKLAEKEKELESVVAEKESVKKEAEEAMASSSAERKKNEEIETKLAGAEEELRQSKEMLVQMKQKLEAQAGEKASMEVEMKRLRIQTEQWRKASEAAASILEQKNLRSDNNPLESNGSGWSPIITRPEADKISKDQKRRGRSGGIRVLGEIWKKRGEQK